MLWFSIKAEGLKRVPFIVVCGGVGRGRGANEIIVVVVTQARHEGGQQVYTLCKPPRALSAQRRNNEGTIGVIYTR